VLAGVEARRHLNFAAIMLTSLGEQQVPEAALERMRHLYARSITLMDNWLGRILQRLDDASLLDDTQVIVTSDHGENLGEQGRLGHAVYLDERLIKVPFVTAGPLDLDLDGAVGLVDIPAALGDALGLADHPWTRRSEDGVVVAQLDRWGTPGDPRLEEAAKTHNLSRRSVEQLAKDLTVATDARWKLVVSDDAESYYDLVADPLEAAPVDPEQVPHDRRTALRASAASARQRPAPSGEAHDAGPTTDDAGGLPSQDVTELEERMKLLGYL
jgi:arylsulfatase A-like enzyme